MKAYDPTLTCDLCTEELGESLCMILNSKCSDGTQYILHSECYVDHCLSELACTTQKSVFCPNPRCSDQALSHVWDYNKDRPESILPIAELGSDWVKKGEEAG